MKYRLTVHSELVVNLDMAQVCVSHSTIPEPLPDKTSIQSVKTQTKTHLVT